MRERGFLSFPVLSLSCLISRVLTGVIWVENRDQIMPVAETAHCWGVEIVSGGRLMGKREREDERKREDENGWKSRSKESLPFLSLFFLT